MNRYMCKYYIIDYFSPKSKLCKSDIKKTLKKRRVGGGRRG